MNEINIAVKCPECSKPGINFQGEGNDPLNDDKYCPSCNIYFRYSDKKKEHRRKNLRDRKRRKKNIPILAGIAVVLLLLISGSLYYYWTKNTEADYVDINDVGHIRGLEAKETIPQRTMSKSRLKDYLQDSITPEDLEDFHREERIYKDLFIIDEEADLFNGSLDSAADQIAGFYDPDTKEMYVIGSHFEPYVNYILSHEYTHALQDQHFELDNYLWNNYSFDESLARLSVVEGDASLVMTKYQADMSWEDLLLMNLDAGFTSISSITSQTGGVSSKALSTLTLFPYIQGLFFVEQIYSGRGWDGVNDLYMEPPVSSEQILHYEKYRSDELPVEISFEIPIDNFILDFSETMGEAFIQQMLDQYLGDIEDIQVSELLSGTTGVLSQEAEDAAQGWGGDRLYHYTGSNGEILWVFYTAWDTANDNTEFDLAYDKVIEEIAYPANNGIFEVDNGYIYKTSFEKETIIHFSETIETLRSLIDI